jgi:hypothetical protein
MLTASAPRSLRATFYQQLHCTYRLHQFDNWMVWAGNHSIQIDGIHYEAKLARAYVGPNRSAARARVRAELFIADIDPALIRSGDIDARLWTDVNARGFIDAGDVYHDDPGHYLPMRLVCNSFGQPELSGNNLIFESDEFSIDATGVFSYTVEFSADNHVESGRKEWISLNDMADNKNGVIVASPEWVRDCPVVAEICARKVGATIEDGHFRSGRLRDVTAMLEQIPADVIYLLPFFRPGFLDLHTGEDVRKGSLGSVYAVRDFYQIDPGLISPPEEADLAELVRQQLFAAADLEEAGLENSADLTRLSTGELSRRIGRERLLQLIGRAELRQLTRRAHELGKKVIFDLVLMQTSRDNPLIQEHPEWYVRNENGVPRIHRIAWLVYSDVALFDLVFNWSLQDYLLRIAPYWIETCDLDGVRIDASQTIDRPFLKKLKNRIDGVRPDGLVLGETLCPLDEALDIPVDMIYALMVDFHRDVEHARPLIDFLEQMHASFAPRTVAMAYFENHDSPRATRIWRDRYADLLEADEAARAWWERAGEDAPLRMAMLKNLQASLIDLSAGGAEGSNLACGLELGSWWGERERTDFENESLLDFASIQRPLHAALVKTYEHLLQLSGAWPELRDGQVYYQRNEFPGGDPEDRIFAYLRHTDAGALLFLHNLDPAASHQVTYTFDFLPWEVDRIQPLFDSCEAGLSSPCPAPATPIEVTFGFSLNPLQSRVLRLYPPA